MLQATALADEYIRLNYMQVGPQFLTVIYSICLEIAIKNNESMVLALEDVVKLFQNQY